MLKTSMHPRKQNQTGSILTLTVAIGFLIFVTISCDSPPWSRFVIANASTSDITVRFYVQTGHTWIMASPYLYTVEEWAKKEKFTSGTPLDRFRVNEEEGWIEAVVSPGAAVEIDRAGYPEVEQNVEGNFLVKRVEIQGEFGSRSWNGKREVFNQFQKEWIGAYRYLTGTSPLYVYYYK
jgi:hypothetical protein